MSGWVVDWNILHGEWVAVFVMCLCVYVCLLCVPRRPSPAGLGDTTGGLGDTLGSRLRSISKRVCSADSKHVR